MNFLICEEVFIDSKSGNIEGRVFKFPIDSNNGEFDYKSRTAINAFNNPKKKRNWNGRILYYIQEEEYYFIKIENFKKSFKKLNIDYKEKKIIELNSIFELYDAIGFDNKTKKYVIKQESYS